MRLLVILLLAITAKAGVLDDVKARGHLNCGVNLSLAGFSIADDNGVWQGLDVQFCRAVAAAIFGDQKKVRFVPLHAQARFTALQSGEIDILSRNTTWTLSRDSSLGVQFLSPLFYDGQGFLVPKRLNVKTIEDLDTAAICIQSGTTTELNMTDTFAARGISFLPVVFEGFQESVEAFFNGRCDAYTTDASALAVLRLQNTDNPDDYVILDELISKEPLAPAVRQGDAQWFTLTRWILFGLLEAEEQGITSQNITSFNNTKNPVIKRMLGQQPGFGKMLGVREDWLKQAIMQVGNYGEIYDTTIGEKSNLQIPRSFNNNANQLWTKGGLHYAPPLR